MFNTKERTFQIILTANSRYLKKWMKLLCSTEEYYTTFIDRYLDTSDLEYSLFEFQSYLKSIGRGQNITIEQIKECIDQKNKSRLKDLMEEMLLVPVDRTELKNVLRLKMRFQIEEFIEEVKEYSSRRFARVIEEYFLFLNEAG
ncbi:MAG: hypothetical protein N3B21_18480 [Clostridia bacterium]|nr:hypothetical protein [Clostridia bacterium]